MVVRLENLTKIFTSKKADKVYAVDKMTLDIPSGKLVGLLGPSGCGKSTTLYMIAGLHRPNEGRIYFGDTDVTDIPPENRGIGLVFQNYALYPHFTVRQNIMFPLENVKDYVDPVTNTPRRYTKEEMETTVYRMAKLVDIEKLLDRKPKQLSGGQQQRVAIARALAKSPRVLLLDEPLSNLDARLRLQTREEIKRIQRETGITTIFVTHDQEEAMSISDFIVVMESGIVQQVDEPQKVYDNPVNLFVAKFLGSPAINILDGEIIKGNLMVQGKVFDTGYEKDGLVKVGIRPENFTIDASLKQQMIVDVDFVEHIGRDISFVGRVSGADSKLRIIVSSDFRDQTQQKQVTFGIKRFFVFDDQGGRIK
jgi:multiple sugar transport system ATP-binding protein